ncbi:CheR family methyltransferase [Sphingomonas lenta]|uniref:Chemotaxis protein CheR n=1 Tax=Sphingomonas lenta TaxID=1141887 RepID=A0A2A2SKF0_9SPHN|nr:protein-glutamate O-methyltransferase CheR [Sphingomonas lenta]PAX09630.1 chemotaxis protein CheR [Sphingomonas lenta]
MLSAAKAAGAGQGATAVLAALLEARTGQQIAQDRAWRLDTALKPLLRERGMESLDQLVRELLLGQDHQLGDRIVDALLNQESSFFRDAPTFDLLGEALGEITAGRRARIWSAGCSTGQEPLSLAMLLAERGADAFEILATDVSEGALARAKAGRFTQFEIQRGLPIRRMMRWFDADGADWVAKPELMRYVSFRRINMVADQQPPGRFDLVMCRNLLMYLAADQRQAVLGRIAAALRPGGLLVLGAGETVIGQTNAFAPSPRWRGLYEAAERAGGRAAA